MDLSPRFTWRKYQRDVLTRLDAGDIAPPLHLVAPPGSGKTLLGIELARRRGLPTVVLSPTTAVAEQWVEKIALFLPDGTDPAAFAARDPNADVWLVSLTYQMLSTVQDASAVFTEAVATQWVDELVADGVSADASAAAAWIARLAAENPERHRESLRRRSVAARRALLRAQPDEVARFLHPNAVAILDRFVARGVGTVVLDECHHLLDHWALVVRYLIGRIEAQSRAAYVVGLTATPPDADDERSYANYAALLGEVDFDVPVPAVVREGDLAPFRELLYLTEPTGPESAFLGDVDAAFTRAVEPALVEPEFIAWMHASCVTATGAVDPEAVNALYDDPDVGTAFAWWFRTVDAAHPAAALFPAPPRGWTPTQARVTLLARYARDVLLLDPAAEDRLMALKRALADFGITITDRGVRQGRSAGDLVLALSGAKCVAAETILTAELDALSGELRAIVVCDYEQHANRLGRTEGLLGDDAGSATRAFRHLAGCAQLATLTPVLMTSSMLQVAGADVAGFVAAVNRTLLETRSETRIGLPQPSAHPWFEVDVIGSRGAELTRAVSMALAAGVTRCLVATRGLIGVGWDCPPVNTLVDLTATASEASSRQLRGRTLRLDPGWPMKVAHNWSVACLDPDRDGGDVDLVRVLRRHSHLFGPDLYADPMLMLDGTSVAPIVAGFRSVTTKPLTEMVQRMVIDPTAIVAGINKTGLRPRSDVIAPHNRIVMRGLDDRRRTRDAWGIGQPFLDQIGRRAVIGVPLAPKWRGRSGLLPLLSVVLAIASLAWIWRGIGGAGACGGGRWSDGIGSASRRVGRRHHAVRAADRPRGTRVGARLSARCDLHRRCSSTPRSHAGLGSGVGICADRRCTDVGFRHRCQCRHRTRGRHDRRKRALRGTPRGGVRPGTQAAFHDPA